MTHSLMKKIKVYIMMVESILKVQQSASQTSNFNSAYLQSRHIYTKKLTIVPFLKPELINGKMCPNTFYKFNNIMGAKYCKKYKATLTRKTQWLIFCYPIMLLKTELLPCNY